MSAENIEIAKRSVDAFNRRDVDALLDLGTADWGVVLAAAGCACRLSGT
jgi:hypothetical protein